MSSAPLYGVGLLDDLHTYFPELLYNRGRFQTVPQVLDYIYTQIETRVNPYARGAQLYRESQQQQQNPVLATPSRPITVTAPSAPARRIQPQRHWSDGGAEGPFGANGYGVYVPPPPIVPLAEQVINPIENIITETYDISSLFHIPTAQRQSTNATTNSLMSILLNAVTSMPRTDLEPVVVRPEPQTIDRATTLRSAREEDEQEVCSVCQDEYTEGQAIRSITHCSHMFHKSCIDQWFERNVHCPVCRYDIRQTPVNE